MDRNNEVNEENKTLKQVALLAEGVDRNSLVICHSTVATVALLAEGVDRNASRTCGAIVCIVALLAEGVDRNNLYIRGKK